MFEPKGWKNRSEEELEEMREKISEEDLEFKDYLAMFFAALVVLLPPVLIFFFIIWLFIMYFTM